MEKPSQSHVLPMPKGFIALRIVQLLLAVIILGLMSFLIANTSVWDIFFPGSYGITMFTAIVTLIIVGYFITASTFVPGIYNMWAFLGCEVFMVLFWLSSMAALAAFRTSFTVPVILFRRALVAGSTHLNVMTGCIVMAAFEMILFVVSLSFVGVKLHNYRTANSNSPTGQTYQAVGAPAQSLGEQHTAYQPQYAQPQQQPQQYAQPQQFQQPQQYAQQQAGIPMQQYPQQYPPQPQQYQGPPAQYPTISPVTSPAPPPMH